MEFDQYKKQFDKSFSSVDPKEFVKEMEGIGYEFEEIKNNIKMEEIIKEIRNTHGIENIDSHLAPGVGRNIRILCDELEKQIKEREAFNKKFELGLNTLKKLKRPFKYDSFGQMVFDKDGQKILDIRGWGWIQKLDNPETRMDSIGELVAELLNATVK